MIYRSAVSNLLPGRYWGNIYGGVEFKTLDLDTSFVGIPVVHDEADLFQIVIGWSETWADSFGCTSVDARIKGNPGGVLSATMRLHGRPSPTGVSTKSPIPMAPWMRHARRTCRT
ncbi:hypothetical protein [Chelativorans sp. YIM 93263]|uniref:hypothetical protein n=1 Tax=Chelativorans sp. YIM 93263 TaxID=2906648 RepID=UPI002378E8B5|nr:hypothetical protein [Chelativorans sp. YIM 93263]